MAWLLSKAEWGTFAGIKRNAYLQGTISRSGNTVTVSGLSLYFTTNGLVWGTATETVNLLDANNNDAVISTLSATWNMGTEASPKNTSNIVYLPNASISVGVSDTTRKLALTAPGGDRAEFTIHFASGASAPTGAFISAYWPRQDYIEITGSVTSFGVGAGPNKIRLLVSNENPINSASQCNYEEGDTLTFTANVSNNSAKLNGGVNIIPNSEYYVGVFASNGTLNTYWTNPIIVYTSVNKASLSALEITDKTAKIAMQIEADGGAKYKLVQYRLADQEEWTTLDTLYGGEARTLTINLSGLTPNTTYTLKSKTMLNGVSSYNNTDFVFTTPSGTRPFYCSVDNQSKLVNKMYCSVNGETKEIKKLYGSVNGQTKRIF